MPKLVCGVCGRDYDVPKHCGEFMQLHEGKELICKVCGETKPLGRCCGTPLEFWE